MPLDQHHSDVSFPTRHGYHRALTLQVCDTPPSVNKVALLNAL